MDVSDAGAVHECGEKQILTTEVTEGTEKGFCSGESFTWMDRMGRMLMFCWWISTTEYTEGTEK